MTMRLVSCMNVCFSRDMDYYDDKVCLLYECELL